MAQSAPSDACGELTRTRRTRTRTIAWASAFATWLGLTVFVLAALTNYASRAGAASVASSPVWPAASKLPRSRERAALVMIAHTKCACTRASLRELERAMARAQGTIDAFVLFVGPRESTASTGLLDLRSMARAIPGVRVIEDEDEARLFGAQTSGQTYLYDAHGALLFRGGITPSRGHEGASVGGETVRRFVSGSPETVGASAQATDVFGCALFNPSKKP